MICAATSPAKIEGLRAKSFSARLRKGPLAFISNRRRVMRVGMRTRRECAAWYKARLPAAKASARRSACRNARLNPWPAIPSTVLEASPTRAILPRRTRRARPREVSAPASVETTVRLAGGAQSLGTRTRARHPSSSANRWQAPKRKLRRRSWESPPTGSLTPNEHPHMNSTAQPHSAAGTQIDAPGAAANPIERIAGRANAGRQHR